MSTATADYATAVQVDPQLSSAIAEAVSNALTMCNSTARNVAIASVPSRETGLITGLVGVHGKVSGFITINMSERMAIKVVEGLLGEKFDELTSQVIDATGEIANIIVGGIKSALAGSPWAFLNITVPSVIVGQGYQISYAKGLQYLSMTFEHEDTEAFLLDDRLMHVSMSLLRL